MESSNSKIKCETSESPSNSERVLDKSQNTTEKENIREITVENKVMGKSQQPVCSGFTEEEAEKHRITEIVIRAPGGEFKELEKSVNREMVDASKGPAQSTRKLSCKMRFGRRSKLSQSPETIENSSLSQVNTIEIPGTQPIEGFGDNTQLDANISSMNNSHVQSINNGGIDYYQL